LRCSGVAVRQFFASTSCAAYCVSKYGSMFLSTSSRTFFGSF
jgi:hypothetical protein